jgi:hypothetical protein
LYLASLSLSLSSIFSSHALISRYPTCSARSRALWSEEKTLLWYLVEARRVWTIPARLGSSYSPLGCPDSFTTRRAVPVLVSAPRESQRL